MCEIGKFVMKMYLQFMSIVKWVVKVGVGEAARGVVGDFGDVRKEAVLEY